MKRKIIYQVLSGIVGAIVLGTISGYNLMIYGANNGCFFLSNGYESCLGLGLVVGVIVGAIIGVLLSRVDWKKFFKK